MNFLPPPPSSARSQQQRRRNTITTPPLHSQQPQFQPQPHPQPPCVAVSPVPTPVAGHTYVSQGSLLPQPVYQQQQQQQQHQTQPAQHQQHQQVQSTQQHNVNTSGHVDWSDMQFLSELKAEINSTPTNTPFGEFVQAPSLPSSESFFTSALPPQQQQQQQQSQNTLTMSSGRTAQPRKMSVPADTSRIQASKTFGCLGDAVEADNNASDSDSDFSNPFDDVPFDDNNDSKEMGALASHNNLMATRSPGNVVSSSAPVLPTNPDALTLTTKKPPAAACVPHLKIQTPRQQSPQHYHQPQQQQQWQGQNETQEHSNDLFFQQEFLSARLETHSKEPSNSFVQSARSTSTSSKNAFNGNNPAPFSYTASAPIGSASAISRSSSVSSISPIQSVSAAVTSARTSKSSKVPKEPKSSPQMVVMDLIDINGTGNVGGSSGSCGKKVMSLNCPTCGFTFFDEKSLSEHMRIHAMAAAATPSSPTTDLLDFLTSPALSPATNSVSAPSSLRKHSSASKTIKAEKGSSSAHFGLFKKHKTISSSSKSKALAESSVGLNDSIASQPMQLIKPVRRLTELESIIIVQSLARRWLVKQRTKNEFKRLRIVKELYETETTYINLLQELFTLYANPLKKFIDDGKPLISIKDVEFIFSQFQEILLFNSTFNVDLKIKKESWNIDSTIADTFLKLDFDRMYKIYSNYTLSYTDILARVLKLSKENPNFEAFIAKCIKDSETSTHKDKTVQSYLILPVQRPPRYVLLLRELLKCTPATHKDHKPLEEAFSKVEDLCSRINETQRKGDDNRKRLSDLFDVGKKIDPELKTLTNSPIRRFVAEDDVTMVDNERKILVERHYFLCSDILIITKLRRSKKYAQKDMVPLTGGYLVMVSDSKVIKDPALTPLSFEIRYKKLPISFVFICGSQESKFAFTEHINMCFKQLDDASSY